MQKRWNTVIFIVLCAGAFTAHAQTPDYLDPDLPVEQRVQDLIGHMTLEEKTSIQLGREQRRYSGK